MAGARTDMRLMGLDVGDKRIGVAISDPQGWLAEPLTVIRRTSLKRDIQTIGELAKEHEVARMIVGLPRGMDGTIGPQAIKVQDFAAEIERRLHLSLVLWDERLTSVAAERLMIEGGVRREKRREKIDSVAAAILLQSYLDFRRRQPGYPPEVHPYED